MDIPDGAVGKAVLTSTTGVFVLLVVWVNTYPFIDEESRVHPYIPDPKWLLLSCAVWGVLFVGGLMSFTLYHMYPHL